MSSKNTAKEPGEFRTSDLYFAAYLQVAGVALKRSEREPSNRVFFIFDTAISNVDELRTAWFNQTGKVPAMPYANAIKTLKSACHMI